MRATTITSWALLAARALEARGIDPGVMFEEAGLDPGLLANPTARYPVAHMQRLWQLAAERTGNPDFGLDAARCWYPTVWHALGYAWLASATLRDALERAVRYCRLVSDALEWELVPSARGVSLKSRLRAGVSPELRDVRGGQDAGLATLVRMARISRGESFRPLAVHFAYPQPQRTDRLEAFFQCQIDFSCEGFGLEVSTEDLDTPLTTSNAELARVNEKVVVDYLARFDRRNLSLAVRTRLLDQLPSGQASEQTIASALNMTPRTMQRRLRDEDTTYKALLEEVRSELATQYVRQSDLSINEITYLLGFSEPSNFTRAFKRWTGSTPSAYREAVLG